MSLPVTRKDIVAARRVYWWLFFAPVAAVPCWLFGGSIFSSGQFLGAVLAAAFPLIFYLPVFFWAFSGNPFVRAHARQGVLLVLLRYVFAVLASSGNAWGFLWCNAFVWLFGSMLGLTQADHGSAWFDEFHREQGPAAPAATATPAAPRRAPVIPETTEYYLEIFRTGNAAERAEAARKLEALGQVGLF